jgi:hypothetical protein
MASHKLAILNTPLVIRIFREHRKHLNLSDLVLQKRGFSAEHGKHVTAQSVSQLVKLLNAHGLILTNSTQSGNNLMDMMWTLQGSERKGVRTVYLTPEGGISSTDAPFYNDQLQCLCVRPY